MNYQFISSQKSKLSLKHTLITFNSVFKKIDEIRNIASEGVKIAKYNATQINDMKEEYDEKLEVLKTQTESLTSTNTDLNGGKSCLENTCITNKA